MKNSKYAIDTYYGMPALGKIAEELNKRVDYDALKAEAANDLDFMITREKSIKRSKSKSSPIGH